MNNQNEELFEEISQEEADLLLADLFLESEEAIVWVALMQKRPPRKVVLNEAYTTTIH